jgi:membrane protease YdiL (CAAX protease family)
VWGPFLSAFILTWKAQGKAGVAELWKSGWRWRIGWTWFAVALLIYPVFKLAALLISGAGVSFQPFTVPLMLLGMAIFHWFLGGPFGEEFGWRGYALPRLLDRFGAVTASLVIGVFWIGWHLPLFIIPGSPQAQLPFWPWAAGVIAMAIIMTWVHRHVGGVVFAAILLHFSANWSNDLIQPATEVGSGWDQPDGIGLILAIVFAAALIPLLSTARRHAQDAQNR